ncbi:hypothetical protein GCM10009678_73840 [Actinomadura kijaniata]|uniref:WD40 repeat protein n=1 Tax=Actinomadura namibiensis TaxID=182080 RepID=A0A7W3LRS0_ACTNM|nr:WD40 repeat domain-containing protein [Actinomadura namibiensis]MBA8953131.1 WD40 repeat protein [Actinomadura namibiensis]
MTDGDALRYRTLYVDPDWLGDPTAYEGPDLDTENQPDFSSGIEAISAASDLAQFALTTLSQGNTESGRLCLFDAATGKWHWRDLEKDRRSIGDGHEIAFSPDGSLVAVAASTDLKAIVWQTSEMTMAWSAGTDAAWGDGKLFTHIGFSGDGRRVVAVSAHPWEPEPEQATCERVVVAEAETGEIIFAATVPIRGGANLDHSGQSLAYIGADDQVLIHDVPSGKVVARHRSGAPGARVLAYAPDGDAVAVGGDGVVEVIRTRTGPSHSIPISGTCQAVNWSWNGLCVLATDDEHATVVDAEGRILWTRHMEDARFLVAAFTHDGRTLVTVEPETTEVIAWFLAAPQ